MEELSRVVIGKRGVGTCEQIGKVIKFVGVRGLTKETEIRTREVK